jgi:hypothetical protein
MSYLNANIPPIYCKIRREYLYDLQKHHGESEECVLFAIASISGRALLFHALLSNGAVYYRLPISAFFQKRFLEPKCRICQSTNYSCGTVLVIILLLLILIFRRTTWKVFRQKQKRIPRYLLIHCGLGTP